MLDTPKHLRNTQLLIALISVGLIHTGHAGCNSTARLSSELTEFQRLIEIARTVEDYPETLRQLAPTIPDYDRVLRQIVLTNWNIFADVTAPRTWVTQLRAVAGNEAALEAQWESLRAQEWLVEAIAEFGNEFDDVKIWLQEWRGCRSEVERTLHAMPRSTLGQTSTREHLTPKIIFGAASSSAAQGEFTITPVVRTTTTSRREDGSGCRIPHDHTTGITISESEIPRIYIEERVFANRNVETEVYRTTFDASLLEQFDTIRERWQQIRRQPVRTALAITDAQQREVMNEQRTDIGLLRIGGPDALITGLGILVVLQLYLIAMTSALQRSIAQQWPPKPIDRNGWTALMDGGGADAVNLCLTIILPTSAVGVAVWLIVGSGIEEAFATGMAMLIMTTLGILARDTARDAKATIDHQERAHRASARGV